MKKLFTLLGIAICNFFNSFYLLVPILLLGFLNVGWGQISISPGNTVTESFTIGTTQTASLPSYWKVDKNTTVRTLGTYSAAVSATEQYAGNSMSSTATNGIYNYGAGVYNTATDRSVGFISSGSATKSGNLYAYLINSGTYSITSLTISYNVEKYRGGTNTAGFSIQMYYSTDGSTWTTAGSNFLTSFSSDASNSGYTSAPGATVSISNQNLNVIVSSGSSIYLAWNYSVTSGTTTSNAQGLGIDDVSITAVASATPTIITTGTLSTFTSTVNTPTTSQTYTVSGSNLTADIVITPPAEFQISTDNSTWISNPSTITLTQSGGTVGTTTIYARYNPASSGTHSGSISHASTGATTQNIAVSGIANIVYYLKESGTITTVSDWGTEPDGSGTSPTDFTTACQTFNIQNNLSISLKEAWTVSGDSSKVILGDGSNACEFTIPESYSFTGKINVSANATLIIQNSTLPTLGTISSSSTVNFAGTGSVTIPINSYGNLTLTSGSKTLSGSSTAIVVYGNLLVDDVTNFAGASSTPFTTTNIYGDFTLSNGTTFDASLSNRITVKTLGTGVQTFKGNGTDFQLFRLDVSNSSGVTLSTTGGTSNLVVGNVSGGGLALTSGNLTLNDNNLTFIETGKGYIYGTGTITPTSNSSIFINSTYNGFGTLNLTSGSQTLNNLTINLTGSTNKNLVLGSNITLNGTLTMTSGNITTGTNILTLGSSTTSLGTLTRTSGIIVGNFARWFAASTVYNVLFPVGSATNSRPINISYTVAPSSGGTLTVSHTESDPGNNSNSNPIDDDGYSVDTYSTTGYWTITSGDGISGGTYSIDIYASGFLDAISPNDYTKLHLLKRADASHDWSIEGTHTVSTGNASAPVIHRTGLSSFSQFGIGSNLSDNMFTGLLPVKLTSFTSSITTRNVTLNWTTSNEQNNSGFEVQRIKTDEQSEIYYNIGFVKGNGNKLTTTNYSFEDKKLNSGKYKYRLKQMDFNGNFKYYNLDNIIEVGTPDKFSLSQNYPNPFNPITKIDFELPFDSRVRIVVYDMLGREVKILVSGELKQAGYYMVELNVINLSSGIYFYRMIANGQGKDFIFTKKMSVVK